MKPLVFFMLLFAAEPLEPLKPIEITIAVQVPKLMPIWVETKPIEYPWATCL